jgi:hypothetical protein
LALSYIFFRSDWDRLSRIMRELNAMMELDSDFDDDSDDDSDDSDEDDSDDLEALEASGDGAMEDEDLADTEPVTTAPLWSENVVDAARSLRVS